MGKLGGLQENASDEMNIYLFMFAKITDFVSQRQL